MSPSCFVTRIFEFNNKGVTLPPHGFTNKKGFVSKLYHYLEYWQQVADMNGDVKL